MNGPKDALTEFKISQTAIRPGADVFGVSPTPRHLSSPKRHCTPLPSPGAPLPSPVLAEGCLQSVIWACGWRCPGAATPAPTPTRPPTATWPGGAHTARSGELAVSGESVSEHRVDALALSAQLPLNHIEGSLRGRGLPGNGPLHAPLSSGCPTPLLPGPAARQPVGTQQVSVSESKGLLVPGRVPQPLGAESSLQRGSQTSCPLPRGPSRHLGRNSTNSSH